MKKRDDLKLVEPRMDPSIVTFSQGCNRSCEVDGGCCRSDTCSPDKRCQGLFSEKFPRGFPLRQAINESDPTDVEKWSRLSTGTFYLVTLDIN